jgi:hypothetical protein
LKIWLFALKGQSNTARGFNLWNGNSLIPALKGRRKHLLHPFRAQDGGAMAFQRINPLALFPCSFRAVSETLEV